MSGKVIDADRALYFIEVVKEHMQKEGQRGKDRYVTFLKLLIKLRGRHPNKFGDHTLQHIRSLLSDYPYLIAELNAFLPNDCKLDLPDQSGYPKPTCTLDDGVSFVRMVADRLSKEKFKRFLVLLDQSKKTGSPDYVEIQKLLSDHAELIQNFEVFKQEKACWKLSHAGSSHAEKVEQQVKHVTGTMIKSATRSKRVQKQDRIGSKAENIEDNANNKGYELENGMYELDMRCEWYSQLQREIKKLLEDKKKDFKSGLSSELIQLEDYLCPRSIRCMKDLFNGSQDDVMEYLNKKGEETLNYVVSYLEEQQRQRILLRERARKLWTRELSQLRQFSQKGRLLVKPRKWK